MRKSRTNGCVLWRTQEKSKMEDVEFLRFVVPQPARDINTRDNLGFCMEYES